MPDLPKFSALPIHAVWCWALPATVPASSMVIILLACSGPRLFCGCHSASPSIMLRYSSDQLVDLNIHLVPINLSALKEYGILRRPRYIHRGSRRQFICSGTRSLIPSLWTVTGSGAQQLRHQSTSASWIIYDENSSCPLLERWRTARQVKREVNTAVLRPLVKWSPPPPKSRMDLLNCQSLTNKASLIHDYIAEHNLDFMCLTETWHKKDVFSSLNEASPPGYTYLEKARVTGRGGGLAVIHHANIHLSPMPLPELTSFECLAFTCTKPSSLTTILIYRPPKPHPRFIPELTDLLMSVCTTSNNVVILGDFNIHIQSPTSRYTTELLQLLDTLNLKQHVAVPTHVKGHTLDLLITNFPVNSVYVHDLGISDHNAVSLELQAPPLTHKPKRHIHFRKIKNINPEDLSHDLQKLSSSSHYLPLNELVELYNTELQHILDAHAPLKTRPATFLRTAPWYTDALRKQKSAGRILERRFITSGLSVHKTAYRNHQKSYAASLSSARSQYFSNFINNSPGNSKRLFKTINHLLSPPRSTQDNSTVEQCNKFLDCFISKIDTIRSSLAPSSSAPATPRFPVPNFSCFALSTHTQVEDLIRKMNASTCPLDPFPTALLQTHIALISTLITSIINSSLKTGHLPSSLKTALVSPRLKKPSLDPSTLSNYRPISNLPFLSKVIEKIVATQIQNHLRSHSLDELFQSGFRNAHSTETALVRVTNDLLMASDQGYPSLLLLLDLSAAFDTIDHSILLHRLQHFIGISHTALQWFQSYLTDRTEFVALGGARSRVHTVACGVPQGSVLGPMLFSIYMLPLGSILRKHGIDFHCYADDTQLYLRLDPSSPTSSIITLTACLEETKAWMNNNFLQLNSNKTEGLLIGTPHQLRSTPLTVFHFSGHNITLNSPVTNLGVRFDPHLSFDIHIKQLCKIAFFHLQNIAKLRPFLSLPDAEKLVHAFVSSRLDYCNALLIGIPCRSLQKLQYIQNCAARILMRVRKNQHITPILRNLHWLPVNFRVDYKICLLTHQCVHGSAPAYLKQLIQPYHPIRQLRSTYSHQLQLPRAKLHSMGERAFQTAAPRLWNALPEHLRAPQPIEQFKKQLKTFLFFKAFS